MIRRARRNSHILLNLHFWVIGLLIIILSLAYYGLMRPYTIWGDAFLPLVYFEFIHSLNGSLFIFPFLYASLVFHFRGALLTWTISILIMFPRLVYLAYNPVNLITNLSYAFLPLLVMGYITLQVNWRAKEKKIIAERDRDRRLFMLQVFNAQEDERQRIARELHDDTIQTLMFLASEARILITKKLNRSVAEVQTDIQKIISAIIQIAEDLKRISLDLRPSIIDSKGLISSIRWLMDRLHSESGVITTLEINGTEKRLNSEKEVAVFRIIQEALNNVSLHSRARNVTIQIFFSEAWLEIVLKDDGIGFLLPDNVMAFASQGKWGIIGMKHRVTLLGGIFNITTAQGKGTQTNIKLAY